MQEGAAEKAREVLVRSLEACGLKISREREGRYSYDTTFIEEVERGGVEHVNRVQVSLRSRVDSRGNQIIKFSAAHTDWK